MIATGFLLFILLTSNPFLRTWPPAPRTARASTRCCRTRVWRSIRRSSISAMSASRSRFAFAVAALIEGRVDAAWARWVRPWTLASWCFADDRHRDGVVVGLLHARLGRLVVLGPGRERLVHAVAGRHRADPLLDRGREARHAEIWTILLAIITFSLSLVGTFLVRSGVLTSVHAFAIDPARGMFILLLLLVAIGGSLTLYAIRAPALKGGGLFAPISREGALVLEQSAALVRLRHGVPRHAIPAVPRRGRRPETVGRISVLQSHLRAVDGADDCRCRHRSAAGVEARRSVGRVATPVGRLYRRGAGGAGRLVRDSWRPDLRRSWLRTRRLDRRRGDRRMGRAGQAVPRRLRRQLPPRASICRAPPTA